MENLQLSELLEEDIEILSPIMKNAFDRDAMMHIGKKDGPPGYDDGSFLRKYALHKDSDAYKILLGNKIIGAVILWINNDSNDNYLGNIFVDVDLQEKGIGLKVWNMIEKMYPKTKVWRADTPLFSRRNHNFYVNKCGFHIIKIENPKSLEDGMVVLMKEMKK